MAYGNINVPYVSRAELRSAIDEMAAAIICGDVSAPLEATSGDALTTRDGVEIRAHRKLNETDSSRTYTDKVVAAAVSGLTRMVEREYLAVR